jgi:hypothetical protein
MHIPASEAGINSGDQACRTLKLNNLAVFENDRKLAQAAPTPQTAHPALMR